MVTLSDDDKPAAEQFYNLLSAYHIAFKQLGSIRQQLLTHARQHQLIFAEMGNNKKGEDQVQPFYVGPQPYGLDTKTYKANQWRIVTGPHAKRYAEKYLKSDITQPRTDIITEAINQSIKSGIHSINQMSSDPFEGMNPPYKPNNPYGI